MIITDETTTQRGKPKDAQNVLTGDKLNLPKFNKLPSPVTARMIGGGEYWIETLDVQTGAMRLDVSGQIDHEDFVMVEILVDSGGVEHDPDDFWIDT